MSYPNEWTQKEFLENKARLKKEGIQVILIDTIATAIEKIDTILYNPYELQNHSDGSVFVFYCYSGNASLNRLEEYKKKFPTMHCISLRGGKSYWRENMMLLENHKQEV